MMTVGAGRTADGGVHCDQRKVVVSCCQTKPGKAATVSSCTCDLPPEVLTTSLDLTWYDETHDRKCDALASSHPWYSPRT